MLEILITVFTILVCIVAIIMTVGFYTIRQDVKSNISPNFCLKDISKKRLAFLRVYLQNSGLKGHAEKYLEYDSQGPIFYEDKPTFIRKLSGDRQLRFQVMAVGICCLVAVLTHSAIATGAFFYIFLVSSLNDLLFIKVIANNPGVLMDE